jgi:adenylate kinase
MVLYGHLLPHSIEGRLVSRAVVLRCEPSVLKQRLAGRGYAHQKVIDNVESELIGVVSSETFESFGEAKTFEIDTTGTVPSRVANSAREVIGGGSEPGPRIDWTLAYDTGAKLRSLLSVGRS